MPAATVDELTEYLRSWDEDHLRGVASYDDGGYDIRYIRDDIRGTRLKSEVDDMIVRLQRESSREEEAAFPFEGLTATLRCFEDVVVLHFPRSPAEGTAVIMDADGAAELTAFLGECLERIE